MLPSWFVCVLGMGTVFVGLLVLVLVCQLLGVIFKNSKDSAPKLAPVSPAAAAAPSAQPTEIPNRQELIAAVSVAIAEELGEDVAAIRITSLKRI